MHIALLGKKNLITYSIIYTLDKIISESLFECSTSVTKKVIHNVETRSFSHFLLFHNTIIANTKVQLYTYNSQTTYLRFILKIYYF